MNTAATTQTYQHADSHINLLPYDNFSKAQNVAANTDIQISLGELGVMSWLERDICLDYKQGVLIEMVMSPKSDIAFIGTKALALADAATTAVQRAYIGTSFTAIAAPNDITITNF